MTLTMLLSFTALSLNSYALTPASPDKKPDERHFTIDSASVEVTEVETPLSVMNTVYSDMISREFEKGTTPTPIDVIAKIDDIIAVGKKIWDIIQANKPVATTDFKSTISVLPRLQGDRIEMDEMGGWSIPVVKSYRLTLKNLYGSEVISFTYSLLFQHSGNYNGVGQYLHSVKIVGSEVAVSWGFTFDAKSELVSIANAGTKANPIGSAVFQVTYKGKSMLKEVQGTNLFYVDGAGKFQKLQ